MRGWPVSRILSKGLPPLDDHSSAAPVAGAVKLPTRTSGLKHPCGGLRPALRQERTFPREVPIRHCSGWGLPCRSCCQSRGGLLPHRFTFTPADRGSLFSVALSLGLPPPGVTRHPCFMESGLSSRHTPRGHPAIRATPGIGATRSGVKRVREAPPWGHRAPAAALPRRHPAACFRKVASGSGQTANLRARSRASAASTPSSGPFAQGRKRRRNALSKAAGSASG